MLEIRGKHIKRGIMLALFFIVSGVLNVAHAQPCEAIATLQRIEGIVKVQPAQAAFPLRDLQIPHGLCAGDKVFTLTNGKALIIYDAGELVLDNSSKVTIIQAQQLNLDEGSAVFEVQRQAKGQELQAHTPLIVIGVKGTRFLLTSQDKNTQVALIRGLIEVQRQDKQEMAYYQTKPNTDVLELSEQERLEFEQFVKNRGQEFAQFAEQRRAEFSAFVQAIALQEGLQLSLGERDAKHIALEAPISDELEQQHNELAQWLN